MFVSVFSVFFFFLGGVVSLRLFVFISDVGCFCVVVFLCFLWEVFVSTLFLRGM